MTDAPFLKVAQEQGFSPYMQSHFQGELGGLAKEVSPVRDQWWAALQGLSSPTYTNDEGTVTKQLPGKMDKAAELSRVERILADNAGNAMWDAPDYWAAAKDDPYAEKLAGYYDWWKDKKSGGSSGGLDPSSPSYGVESGITDDTGAAAEQAKAAAQGDPWENFLKNYDWKNKYAVLTPSQKGVSAGRYTPKTTWS
jgi:hypothetical protein